MDPKKNADVPDTNGWLTREESARLLGVAVQTVKNYTKRGLLCPQRALRRDIKGREQVVVVYDPRELTKVREALQAKSERTDMPDTSTWLTRNESTDIMSVSTQTLKNYEQQGKLHPLRVPRRDTRGHEQIVVVYDPKELAKLPRGVGRPFSPREPGELNARCNELFEQGKSIREIVVELRETSEKINALHDSWLNDGGANIVIAGEAKTNLEAMLGPFTDVAGLILLVTAKLAPKA